MCININGDKIGIVGDKNHIDINKYYGLQLTPKENKLFGIIRALDDSDDFIERIIQDGVELLQSEFGYHENQIGNLQNQNLE